MKNFLDRTNTYSVSINDISGVGEVRRLAVRLANELGFDETEAERAAIVVTEAATNLVKYAGEGQMLFRELENGGLEILVLDKGPGIANLAEALSDGFSTRSTPGGGLGAINRLSDTFQIHSQPGGGTALLSQLWPRGKVPEPQWFEIGVVCLPHPKETVYGDGWATRKHGEHRQILVSDGLGHGSGASMCTSEVKRLFERREEGRAPAETLQLLHQGVRHTRGAAVAVAEVNRGRELRFAGVGNISGVVLTGDGPRHLVSHNGIVGHEARKIAEFEYEWMRGALLVMHTDGLQTRWNLENYPGLLLKHPALIAGVLYRDFKRGSDDVTVLAFKEK